MLITFDRVARFSISFPHWKGLLNTFLTMYHLSGLVAKTTLLWYITSGFFSKTFYVHNFWSTSPNFIIFNRDLWDHEPVQMKLTELQSVQPVLRKSSVNFCYIQTQAHIHTHRHVFDFRYWVDMYTWRYT